MSKIDREATFRGEVVDGSPSVTSKDNLQLCLALRGAEIWDEEDKVWVKWGDDGVEECEITGYLVLISGDGAEIFHYKSVEKAFEIEFNSVTELDAFEFVGKQIQFRVEESTYKDKTSLKVAGIDHYDAEPGQRVQKLDEAKIKSLDAKYATFFRGRKGEKKPVKPVTKPTMPAKPKSTTKPTTKSKVEKPAPSTKKPAPKKPVVKKKPAYTEDLAWKEINTKAEANEEILTQLWYDVIETLNPDGGEKNEGMTSELWEQVTNTVIARANEGV